MSAALPGKLVRLLVLSTAVVLGEWEAVRRARRAAPPGEPDREWREAILQTHLFAGFPRLVEALGVLASEGGLGAADPGERDPEDGVLARGEALFGAVYGDDAARVRATLEERDPLFAGWILEHAYGRVLSRPGLDARDRELLAVAALAATGQDRQLAGHARGALRCGAAPSEPAAALDAVAALIDPTRLERAHRVIERCR